MKTDFILSAAKAVQRTILANENTLESLDRAIGDGDHYINMKRGANAIVDIQAELAPLNPSEAINLISLLKVSIKKMPFKYLSKRRYSVGTIVKTLATL